MFAEPLRTFVAVADAGGFTRAAAALRLSQPTVSGRIRTLENTIGAVLFQRQSGGVALTATGAKLLPYARQIVALSDEALTAIATDGEPLSRINVGTVPSITTSRLLPVVEYIYRRYPRTVLSMHSLDCCDTLAAVRRGELDCAFVVDSENYGGDLRSTVLCPEPLVLVAGPAHPLVDKPDVTPAELREFTMIQVDRGARYHEHFQKLLNVAGEQIKAYELDSADAAKQSLAAGLGFALIPEIAVSGELADGRLRRIDWSPPFAVHTQFVVRRERQSDTMIGALLAAAREVVEDQADAPSHAARSASPGHG